MSEDYKDIIKELDYSSFEDNDNGAVIIELVKAINQIIARIAELEKE